MDTKDFASWYSLPTEECGMGRKTAGLANLQPKMSRASIEIAAPIYFFLLSLVVAAARRHDEGGRCVAAHLRLSELRAEIAVAEHEVQAACSAGVDPVSLKAPAPPLEGAVAEGAGGLGPPVAESRSDAASTGSGRRRRRPSGTAPQSTQIARNNFSPAV